MAYEVVSKKLKIESCRLTDLTEDQIQKFLSLWGEGADISAFAIFGKEDGTVVLNKDNQYYGLIRDMAYCVLGKGPEEFKQKVAKATPECLREIYKVLEEVVKLRKRLVNS